MLPENDSVRRVHSERTGKSNRRFAPWRPVVSKQIDEPLPPGGGLLQVVLYFILHHSRYMDTGTVGDIGTYYFGG